MTLNIIVTLESGLRPLKVIESGTIRKLGDGFQFHIPYYVTMAVSLAILEIFSVR